MAGEMVDKVQETASQLVGSAGGASQAAPVMDQAAEQVSSRLDMGKEYLAETVTGVATALRKSGQQLREEGTPPMLAQYAERGADQIERFGTYLSQRNANDIVTDVEAFARRQPMVFASGAFALGMLAVRFLRSGSQAQSPTSSSWSNGSAPGSSTSAWSGTSGASPSTTQRTVPSGYPSPGSAPSGSTGAGTPTPTPTSTSPSVGARPAGGLTGPGTPAETGAPTPTSSPPAPFAGTPINSGTSAPTPRPGARPIDGASTSERTGTGGLNKS
jgi:hypothetical protein